jgi:hypothetical protein
MRDAFLAVDAATDLRAHARDLRRWWDATFSGTTAAPPVRPVIARSWSRMTGAGLDPERLRPRSALATDALADVRASSPLRATLPALRHHLGTIADDAEHVMVLCDAMGRILWLEGHPRVLEQAKGITFEPGMLWTEHSAGTNAIGTALAIDHPVQVFSAEHFLPEQHPWWCSAAPLHDPVTGDLLGVIDVSGPQRTAHPYSLTLVTAATRIAEAVLHERRLERDNSLRQTYLDRIRRSRGASSALIDECGRVLLAMPASWVSGVVDTPHAPGRVRLPSGGVAEAEPLGDGAWVLWGVDSGTVGPTPQRPRLHLRLLGRHGHTVAVGEAAPRSLSLRQAEAVALLVLHPEGMTAKQLTLHLYGDEGKPVSVRALMSRLRTLLGGCLSARPYRLDADVDADVHEVTALLAAGEVTRALARYRGPLLADSEVERIVAARDELAAATRRAALDAGGDALWMWLDSDHGRDDVEAVHRFARAAEPDDPRRDAAAARLRLLEAADPPARMMSAGRRSERPLDRPAAPSS